MTDDLDDELNRWGMEETPPVDGVFANRLESQLRQEMLEQRPNHAPGLGWLFRPGVLVIVVVGIAFAFNRGEPSSVGVADDGSTTSAPTTTTPETPAPSIVTTTTTDSMAPTPESTSTTTLAPTSTTAGAAQTTTAPTTTTTTAGATSTTVAPAPEVVLTLERDQKS